MRRQVLQVKLQARDLLVTAAFMCLKLGGTFNGRFCGIALAICARSRFSGTIVQQLRDTKRELRAALRRDKAAYLSQLASQAADLPTRDVVRRLRPLLAPQGARRLGVRGCRRSA